jgi:4-hydroxy-3-methylbut-2-enyl diphosphate reductase
VDVVIVVGSPTSSNSNRLREVARKLGAESHMIDSADELKPEWVQGKARIGLTAGASAPGILLRQVIERLRALGAVSVRQLDGIEEAVRFPLPKGLKLDGAAESELDHLN